MSNEEICLKVLKDNNYSDEEKIKIIQSLKENKPDNTVDGTFSAEDEILNEDVE